MKNVSRRKFLQLTGLTAGATMLPLPVRWLGTSSAHAFYQSPGIPLYGTPLRGVGPGAISVALPDGSAAPVTGVTHYTFDIQQFTDPGVCPSLGPTTLWGYHSVKNLGGAQPQRHLGGVMIGERGVPIQLTFRNKLPTKHIIPVDVTIAGANQGSNRSAVHLHGGLVPWVSDGGPFDWFSSDGRIGASFLNNQVLNPNAPNTQGEYYYPLNQSARFLWYHDHAFGITRVNAYSGIASALLVRDNFERYLVSLGLPDFIELGGREIPLVVQDKIFVGSNIKTVDPTWQGPTAPGSLWYAHLYERTRWRRNFSTRTLPNPSVIPEFFGDTMLVNGTTFPSGAVEPRRYRLRVLNACNARFLNLQLYIADGSPSGITLDASGNPTNQPFVDGNLQQSALLQIGSEGGFLAKAVAVPTNVPSSSGTSLLMGPAERADIIIDFSNAAGQKVILYSDAAAPFPSGDPRNDYFPGLNTAANPSNARSDNGLGPNTRILMRFDVASTISGPADPPLSINEGFDFVQAALANNLVWNDPLLVPPGDTNLPSGVFVRQLSLNETFDDYGRLLQRLGTLAQAPNGAEYLAPATEIVTNGNTEVWEIYNTTGDVHPIHFHLVNVQIINRQDFGPGFIPLPGIRGPEANEVGWKETVLMYPNTITRVIMKFEVPQILTSNNSVVPTPLSPRPGAQGYHEYVWHCHILEHEEHDMMRPLLVSA